MKKLILILFLSSNAAFAQKMVKSGSIYTQHPDIEVMKKVAALYEKGDAEGMAKFYANAAQFTGMGRYNPSVKSKTKSLTEAKTGWVDVITNWDNIKMTPTKDPVALQYADGTVTVQSWWTLALVNKKTKKSAAVGIVFFDTFNSQGKITSQLQYYDPAPIIAAMK